MLEISILGEQRVAEDGHVVAALHAPRALALLAYLALHRGAPQQRQQVAALFWPESSDGQARTNLRRELHHLRAHLPGAEGCLLADGSTLLWRADAGCRLDVAVFEAAAGRAAVARAAGEVEQFRSAAREALAAYGGDLLPALYDDWVLGERERLRRRCLAVLDDLVAVEREAGDLAAAIGAARRRIELEPLEESPYRLLLELQARAGDRAAAIRTYHRCVSVLERELGVDPDPATTATYQRLLSDGSLPRPRPPVADPKVGEAPARAAVPGSRVPLVGRERERREIEGAWQQALAGGARVALVSGEAGLGKTRLVQELAAARRAERAAVAWARCFAGEGRPALAPVSDWLRASILRRGLDRLDPALRTEVERLVPPAGSRDRDPRPADGWRPLADAWQRHRFFDALARGVLAAGRPTLLVLDDLQWCDEATLGWLQTLLRVGGSAPVLVLATARPEELDDDAVASSAVRELRAAGAVTEVELAPLDEAETAALAGHLLDASVASGVVQWLQAVTQGNPLFVVEAVRGADLGVATGPDVARLPRVHAVLERRLEPLSRPARELAGLAAAIGRDFSLELLGQASDLDSEGVVEAVDELWRRRILRERSGGTYDFTHDLLRDVAYADLPPARRRLAHRRIAQALELVHGSSTEPVAAALADQYDRAGEASRAVRYHTQAAEAATAVFGNATAVRHYRRALDLLARQPVDPGRDRQELAVRYAMSGPLNAIYGYSSPELQHVLEGAFRLAERQGETRLQTLILVALWGVRFVQGHTAESHALAARAQQLGTSFPELAGHALLALGGSATSLGRPAEGAQRLLAVRDVAMDAELLPFGVRPEVHSQAWAAHALSLLGREAQARAAGAWAVERAKQTEHPYSLVVALAYAAITAQLRDDREAATEAARALQALCARYEYGYYAEWGVIIDGWAAGGVDGAARIRSGLTTLRRLSAHTRHPYYLGLLGDTLITLGQESAAGAVLAAAETAALAHEDRWWLPELWRLQARLRPGTRAALLDRAAALAAAQGSELLRRRAEADLADVPRAARERVAGTAR